MCKDDPDDLKLYGLIVDGGNAGQQALLEKYALKLHKTLYLATQPLSTKKDVQKRMIPALGMRMSPSAKRPKRRGELVRGWLYRLALEVAEDWLNNELEDEPWL
jgi:hypothetical protein